MPNKKTDNNQSPRRRFRGVRIFLRVLAGIVSLAVVSYLLLAWYVSANEEKVRTAVTEALNKNLNGEVSLQKLEPALLQGLPGITFKLDDVVLRDSLYPAHRKTLLKAARVEVAINALSFLDGKTEIERIDISDAEVFIYTDADGYSNTALLKDSKGTGVGKGENSLAIQKLRLKNVRVKVLNLMKDKEHDIFIDNLKTNVKYTEGGWSADVDIEAFASSLAFNTNKGSYIKGKAVKGRLHPVYDRTSGMLNIGKTKLEIGEEPFNISALFFTKQEDIPFKLNISNDLITWQKTRELLAENVSGKLEAYNLAKPFSISSTIKGKLKKRGNPFVEFTMAVADNTLDTPGGSVEHCSFKARYVNNHDPERGFTDENSVITFTDFNGEYKGIGFTLDEAVVKNLKEPVVSGNIRSSFAMEKLVGLVDTNLINFKRGECEVKLNFKANVEDFMLNKPYVEGSVVVKNADISYTPRKLDFRDVNVNLDFTRNDLYISRISLKGDKSIVNMEGTIKNFLNLYYTDPEKVVLEWKVKSPALYLEEFTGFAGGRKVAVSARRKKQKGDFTEDLNTLFDKSRVQVKLDVDKLYHKKFYATDATANVLLTDKGITIHDASLWHSGGRIALRGTLMNGNNSNDYNIATTITDVNVSRFLYTFDNFGMEALNSENLKGQLSADVILRGSINADAGLMPETIKGSLNFSLNDAALVNFEPVKDIGKIAFPFRNFDNITFSGLKGSFTVGGEKVGISPMEISSSVINMDVEGIYAFGPGTEIYIAVPLRNPKRDRDITDEDELAKRRHRGIVINLIAADDDDGKVKIKLGKKKD